MLFLASWVAEQNGSFPIVAAKTAEKGWSVYVAYLEDGPNSRRLREAGVTLIKVASRSNHDPLLVWRLFRL